MSRSFSDRLRANLDAAHQSGKLATCLHYRIKKEMRAATMRGESFKDAEALASAIARSGGVSK